MPVESVSEAHIPSNNADNHDTFVEKLKGVASSGPTAKAAKSTVKITLHGNDSDNEDAQTDHKQQFTDECPNIEAWDGIYDDPDDDAEDNSNTAAVNCKDRIVAFGMGLLHPVAQKKKTNATFQTWSGTISTDFPMHEPRNDTEILQLMSFAKANDRTVRVVGHTHSQGPLVAGKNESVVLIRLNRYKSNDVLFPGFRWASKAQAGESTREVWVNSSWAFEKLYEFTLKQGYFMASETAGNGLSIGGVFLNCVHGSSFNQGLLNDSVTGVRMIRSVPNPVTSKESADHVQVITNPEKLKLIRNSLGLLGICTHFRIRLYRHTKIISDHIFSDKDDVMEYTEEWLERRILCDTDKLFAQECFYDPYFCPGKGKPKGRISVLRWGWKNDPQETRKTARANKTDNFNFKPFWHAPKPADYYKDGFAMNETMEAFLAAPLCLKYTPCAAEMSTRTAFLGLEMMIEENEYKNGGRNDMFYIEWAPKSIFMGYFFPVDQNNVPGTDGYDSSIGDSRLKVVNDVLKATNAIIRGHEKKGSAYIPDVIFEFRFVRSSPNNVFSPIYEKKGDPLCLRNNKLWMKFEIVAYSKHLDVTFSEDSHLRNPSTKDFMKFWYDLEQVWINLPTFGEDRPRPHFGKMFGIEPRNNDPSGESGFRAFSYKAIRGIFTDYQKKKLIEACNEYDPIGLFDRQFAQRLKMFEEEGDQFGEVNEDVSFIPTSVNYARYEYLTFYFWAVLIPYWFSAIIYHSIGILFFYLMVYPGYTYIGNDVECLDNEDSLWWWYLVRSLVGISVLPLHIIFLPSRINNLPGVAVQNVDDGSMFWNIIPLCDVGISSFIASGLCMLRPLSACGLDLEFKLEVGGLIIIFLVLMYRVQARLRGVYYSTFHYLGSGALVCQRFAGGSICDCGNTNQVFPAPISKKLN